MNAVRNRYLSASTAREIDSQVAKVIRNLGTTTPPVRLEEVQELLKLDRQFYTKTDTGFFRESVSRIRVGVHQVFERPMLVAEAIKKLSLRALYVPDQKRIFIDSELPDPKIRWATAHEITHDLCYEWHQDALFGDSEHTVSEACHEQIELEANYGAGRLLTLQDLFIEEIRGSEITLRSINALAKKYENTWASMLWRTVEGLDYPAFGVLGEHPHHKCTGDRIRYFIRSRSFEEKFASTDEQTILSLMRSVSSWSRRGPLSRGDHVDITNTRGETCKFSLEVFGTAHDVLTLGQIVQA